jgi:hypothetical protein
LNNVIVTVFEEQRAPFSAEDISNTWLVNKDFANIVPKMLCWLQVDFTPICQPRLGYKDQTYINPHCIKMASAAMVYFGLDPGKFVRYLAGKYTGQHQDDQRTLDAVQNHVNPEDYEHIKRILLHGCPAQ